MINSSVSPSNTNQPNSNNISQQLNQNQNGMNLTSPSKTADVQNNILNGVNPNIMQASLMNSLLEETKQNQSLQSLIQQQHQNTSQSLMQFKPHPLQSQLSQMYTNHQSFNNQNVPQNSQQNNGQNLFLDQSANSSNVPNVFKQNVQFPNTLEIPAGMNNILAANQQQQQQAQSNNYNNTNAQLVSLTGLVNDPALDPLQDSDDSSSDSESNLNNRISTRSKVNFSKLSNEEKIQRLINMANKISKLKNQVRQMKMNKTKAITKAYSQPLVNNHQYQQFMQQQQSLQNFQNPQTAPSLGGNQTSMNIGSGGRTSFSGDNEQILNQAQSNQNQMLNSNNLTSTNNNNNINNSLNSANSQQKSIL